MEEDKRRRWTSKKSQKAPLMSIVDPWDVKVAAVSVDPVRLAGPRRQRDGTEEHAGVVGGSAAARSEEQQQQQQQQRPQSLPAEVLRLVNGKDSSGSGGSGVNGPSRGPPSPRTPWPWYKPTTPVIGTVDCSAFSSPTDALASAGPAATADVPIEQPHCRSSPRNRRTAVEDTASGGDSGQRESSSAHGDENGKSVRSGDEAHRAASDNPPAVGDCIPSAPATTETQQPPSSLVDRRKINAPPGPRSEDEVDAASSRPDDEEAEPLVGGRSGGGDESRQGQRGDGDKSSLVSSLVEDLVRSRYRHYNSEPPPRAIHRKSGRQQQPPPEPSPSGIDRTDKNEDSDETLNRDFPTKSSSNLEANVDGVGQERSPPPTNKIREYSLSMPLQLDDMDELRIRNNDKGAASKFRRTESDSSSGATFSNSGSTLNGSTLGSETEEEENEEESTRMPLQSGHHHHHQRQSANSSAGGAPTSAAATAAPVKPMVASDRMEFPTSAHQSANSTITSVNSISSLLKEKLQWTIPQALRSSKKRQNADYRLRGFVGFLFLCIVFLVGFAHVYYTQHVLQRAYFDKFRFNKNERLMHVYNSAGVDIIAARLGVGIPADTGVFPCLPQHQRPDKVCLEWLQHSRLYLSHTKRDAMNCYHITWQSLNPGVNPKDCFDWSPKRGHWYGAGQIQSMAYPLEQGRLDPSPFVTGDIRKHPFGNVLKRYFLNSKGATITVDPETPLYVSINSTQNKELCLMAKHDAFAFINHLTPFPQLNYSICATDNMKSLHSLMAEKFLWDGLKPDELQAIHSLLTEPVWQISPTNEADIYNYTEDVIALGFLRQGHVLLSEEWQPSSGDLVLDETRFKSMKETIDVIHRRGFRIVFTVQPFISTESENFKDAVKNRLLISERGSDPRIPALTRYRQVNSAAVLDITNNKTLPWLQSKLEPLMDKYHVDSFYLDLGTAHDMPHYYKCEQPLTNPDHYKTLFVNSILGSVPVIGVSSAIARPRAPVFVSLPPFPSSWKAIKTVIPTVLSYGIVGYPFVMPGAVGGDVALPMSDNNPDNDFEVNLPDKELYIRWLQLSTFLPVIRFTHLPSKYSDDSVLEIAKSLTTLRQKTVTPLLKKYANVTLDTGLPIIRPLWMLDPSDPACHLVMDEFSVGEELIVAPIIHSGSRQREVYLPAGVWKDGIDKSLRKGSRWIHNYRVAEDKIAYFVKMPDDMRF